MVLNLQKVMKTSKNKFISHVLFNETDPPEGRRATRSKSKKASQGRQFRKQLNTLMQTLDNADPHYIRCIKPNQTKRANTFQAITTLEQLRYSGLFEAVHIRKQGYPFRLLIITFFSDIFFLLRASTGCPSSRAKKIVSIYLRI